MDRLFREAKELFKKQTHESMNRDFLSNEEVRKLLPPGKVIAGLIMVTLGYKAVDAYVT